MAIGYINKINNTSNINPYSAKNWGNLNMPSSFQNQSDKTFFESYSNSPRNSFEDLFMHFGYFIADGTLLVIESIPPLSEFSKNHPILENSTNWLEFLCTILNVWDAGANRYAKTHSTAQTIFIGIMKFLSGIFLGLMLPSRAIEFTQGISGKFQPMNNSIGRLLSGLLALVAIEKIMGIVDKLSLKAAKNLFPSKYNDEESHVSFSKLGKSNPFPFATN